MIAQTCRDNLAALAAAFAKATGSSLEQVSKQFYGNRGFLRAFKRGERSVSIDKFDGMIAAFVKAWPEGAEWPFLRAAVIPRPAPRRPRRRKTVPKQVSAEGGPAGANHLTRRHADAAAP